MIGVSLILISMVCFTLSFMMFLNRGFLIIGNFSFLAGICALTGPKIAMNFFIKKSKLKFTACYTSGLTLIIIGWKFFTLAGFALQIYGIFMLFRSFIKIGFEHC